MSSILPGHEDLREKPVLDQDGRQVMVTIGNGTYYPLLMGPTGVIRAGSPTPKEKLSPNG